MYSSEDLERFYFKYQTEALPHGQSLQSFCLSNKVPYSIFSKWYRDTRREVVAVLVDDCSLRIECGRIRTANSSGIALFISKGRAGQSGGRCFW